ncbi:hypothetical protein W02_41680 [Nitrospira sp. KM1]|nr:hypothetical protein W02_41680 [Nitrospira sp. KM1]
MDAFGDLQELRSQYEEFHRTWKNSVDRLQSLKNQGAERGRRDELLRFQLQEIEQTAPQRDEEASLQTEYQRLLHASRLREWTEDAHALLQSDDAGALTTLGKIGRLLHEIGQTDPDMKDCGQQLQEAAVALKDLAGRLRNYADSLEADPQRLDVVSARLDAIRRLGKKYGGSVEAVLSAEERIRAELAMLENLDGQIGELTVSCDQAAKRISAVSTQLSKKRREAAVRLTGQVRAELSALKMVQTGFHISMERDDTLDACGPTGSDRVEFLLNNNPGEPPRPLGRIASGGELSRIMLSLKTVLSKRDRVPVVIFDEIDTGVGGAVAAAMGIRLRKLGMFHQVFCITHLPQVASQAEHHFLVNKREVGGRVTTVIESLNDTGREAEVARMLGGVTITRKVRETAAELIKNSKQKG